MDTLRYRNPILSSRFVAHWEKSRNNHQAKLASLRQLLERKKGITNSDKPGSRGDGRSGREQKLQSRAVPTVREDSSVREKDSASSRNRNLANSNPFSSSRIRRPDMPAADELERQSSSFIQPILSSRFVAHWEKSRNNHQAKLASLRQLLERKKGITNSDKPGSRGDGRSGREQKLQSRAVPTVREDSSVREKDSASSRNRNLANSNPFSSSRIRRPDMPAADELERQSSSFIQPILSSRFVAHWEKSRNNHQAKLASLRQLLERKKGITNSDKPGSRGDGRSGREQKLQSRAVPTVREDSSVREKDSASSRNRNLANSNPFSSSRIRRPDMPAADELERQSSSFIQDLKKGNTKRQLSNWSLVLEKGRLCLAGEYNYNPDDINDRWMTTPVEARISSRILKTKSGTMYEIVGSPSSNYDNDWDFPRPFIPKFLTGFPLDWQSELAVVLSQYGNTGPITRGNINASRSAVLQKQQSLALIARPALVLKASNRSRSAMLPTETSFVAEPVKKTVNVSRSIDDSLFKKPGTVVRAGSTTPKNVKKDLKSRNNTNNTNQSKTSSTLKLTDKLLATEKNLSKMSRNSSRSAIWNSLAEMSTVDPIVTLNPQRHPSRTTRFPSNNNDRSTRVTTFEHQPRFVTTDPIVTRELPRKSGKTAIIRLNAANPKNNDSVVAKALPSSSVRGTASIRNDSVPDADLKSPKRASRSKSISPVKLAKSSQDVPDRGPVAHRDRVTGKTSSLRKRKDSVASIEDELVIDPEQVVRTLRSQKNKTVGIRRSTRIRSQPPKSCRPVPVPDNLNHAPKGEPGDPSGRQLRVRPRQKDEVEVVSLDGDHATVPAPAKSQTSNKNAEASKRIDILGRSGKGGSKKVASVKISSVVGTQTANDKPSKSRSCVNVSKVSKRTDSKGGDWDLDLAVNRLASFDCSPRSRAKNAGGVSPTTGFKRRKAASKDSKLFSQAPTASKPKRKQGILKTLADNTGLSGSAGRKRKKSDTDDADLHVSVISARSKGAFLTADYCGSLSKYKKSKTKAPVTTTVTARRGTMKFCKQKRSFLNNQCAATNEDEADFFSQELYSCKNLAKHLLLTDNLSDDDNVSLSGMSTPRSDNIPFPSPVSERKTPNISPASSVTFMRPVNMNAVDRLIINRGKQLKHLKNGPGEMLDKHSKIPKNMLAFTPCRPKEATEKIIHKVRSLTTAIHSLRPLEADSEEEEDLYFNNSDEDI